ncbi:MAG: hypothetical protein R2849_03585 [Thermomicrobiales bacterium]
MDATAAGPQDVLDRLAEERRANQGNRVWQRLKSERKALVGLVIVGLLALIAIASPVIAPYDPDADDFGLFVSPSLDHPMGTDSFGRDLFSRVLIGTRVSLTIGVLAALAATIVGVSLGLVSGYYGGWIDSLIMIHRLALGISCDHSDGGDGRDIRYGRKECGDRNRGCLHR